MAIAMLTPTAVAARTTEKLSSDADAEALRQDVLRIFRDAANNSDRNLQRAIGPSETGHPCARNIAHKLAGTPETDSKHLDPLPSILGTAAHAWAAEALERENRRTPGRFIIEHRVTVAPAYLHFPPLTGSGDGFDTWTGTVLDWKWLGTTQWREYLNGYVSAQYREQTHQYGLGFANLGYDVKRVALVIIPRNKSLRDTFVWSEAWDSAVAHATVARLRQIQLVIAAGHRPNDIRATPGGGCYFCPFKGGEDKGLCGQSGKAER
jgi:hypothetical protein